MKTKLSILLVLSFFLSISVFAQKKSSKELKAEKELLLQKKIETLIDSKNFVFEAQKISPRGGRVIFLDYNTYFLKFNEEKVTCDLPFFGRGYNIGYGSDGGIKFDGKPEDIKVEKKNKSYNIKAIVKGKDDVYNLMFSVFFNGSTTLSVNSNNRSSITYYGEISAPKVDADKKQ
ncbi:DUF4251 domain-containing protein [Flavobacterium sp. LS1R47]|uniref:DUF4251 domain-containing protein n=1 Tax=Flavobacterium frigoritolerans TaxID=2987686 RepID=A0A9X2ZNG4_9FLAO|nr:DUF4251 domain-containing protein [Flavobacterium frigoritolerans]MCV9932977.1 DUF4251 domain-containing protein [Flavobacterium frigoritolerans]